MQVGRRFKRQREGKGVVRAVNVVERDEQLPNENQKSERVIVDTNKETADALSNVHGEADASD